MYKQLHLQRLVSWVHMEAATGDVAGAKCVKKNTMYIEGR
jgi:hypothetical protein